MGKSWIIALAAVFVAGIGPAPQLSGEPPLEPRDETPVAPPATPHADCIAKTLQALSASHGELTRAIVTRSRRWGDVWRADFDTPDVDPPLVNRAVCASGASQIALGQSLSPLPVPPPESTRPSSVRCVYTPFENPCRNDPVEVISLCVRPSLYLYPDGRTETVAGDDTFEVGFINQGRLESDADWERRCAPRGGPYRGD